MKLDIGGGTHKCDPDFISVDLHGGDVTAPMWDLPFADGSIEFIWSSHTLEHAEHRMILPTLKEWFRVLKPGGAMIVRVPDFDYVANYWLNSSDRVWAEMIVFGHQAHEGEFHKCAFTKAILRARLEEAGFEVRTMERVWSHGQETLQAVCLTSRREGE